jgi:hypothetical protein
MRNLSWAVNVIGEDGDFAPAITVRGGRALHLDLTVNAKHFCHFWIESGSRLDWEYLDLRAQKDHLTHAHAPEAD